MSLINVRRDVSDNFYRYKMERLQTKIEGKGNGIKTVVVNLPGSPVGCRDGIAVLRDVLPHAVDQVHGGDHPPASGG